MSTLDLKPLTKETIDQMGYDNHHLWLVKIGEETFGPFETESLKHYAFENEAQFEEARASRADTNDFRPFWSHAHFQKPVVHSHKSQIHYWILVDGQKHGPHTHQEIEKKIETGDLFMTDYLSVDHGENWKKIFLFEGFDHRHQSADELPPPPSDTSFQEIRAGLIEKLEKPHRNVKDELAEIAHSSPGSKSPLKLEELTLASIKSSEISESLKWAVPGAAAVILTLATAGYLVLSPSVSEELVADTSEVSRRPSTPNPSRNFPRAQIPSPTRSQERSPSSIKNTFVPNYEPQESRYPTTVETHEEAQYEQPPEPMDQVENQTDPQQQTDNSLVNNEQTDPQESLDAAMNQTPPQEAEPKVEESSDF